MKRKDFLKYLAILPLSAGMLKLNAVMKLSDTSGYTPKMPLLFLGHGSPMNAIEENEFVENIRKTGQQIPKPKAIICISAHWETQGTFVTAMPQPKTIHDFGGFPRALYEVNYPAPGSPELAGTVQSLNSPDAVNLNYDRGLDHGAWSVIKHLYPKADVPIIELSLDYRKSPSAHYELAKSIAELRNKGVLVIGSGNLVHNLRMVAWNKLVSGEYYAYDWATEAIEKMKQYILKGEHDKLINYKSEGKAFSLAVPTPEHFLPLLYILALKGKDDDIQIFNDKPVGGSLDMTSVKIG